MSNYKIAILGDGGWGTALALVLARKSYSSCIWGVFPDYIQHVKETRENNKFLPNFSIPEEIELTSNLEKAVQENDILVCAIPTTYLRSVLKGISSMDLSGKIFISCTKGIENETYLRPTEIIHFYIKGVNTVVLSGPTHAEEVAKNIPTCVVASSNDSKSAKVVQDLFIEDRFRVYTSNDVIGAEYGGALKNVIAIAAGICDGLGFGDNTKSALLARGLQELIRLGVKNGAKKETFFGLTGMGDLVTTCFSPFGRNRMVGEKVGKGQTVAEIMNNMEMVAEGVNTALSAYNLAKQSKVEMPIISEVYKVLYENKSPMESISDLMMRDSKDEMVIV